jgi:hypothetical protein
MTAWSQPAGRPAEDSSGCRVTWIVMSAPWRATATCRLVDSRRVCMGVRTAPWDAQGEAAMPLSMPHLNAR